MMRLKFGVFKMKMFTIDHSGQNFQFFEVKMLILGDSGPKFRLLRQKIV